MKIALDPRPPSEWDDPLPTEELDIPAGLLLDDAELETPTTEQD